MRGFYERYLCVRKLPVPVVAAINGPAIGAGLCLALACDMRIAATTAKMGVTFVGLGLHPVRRIRAVPNLSQVERRVHAHTVRVLVS